MYQFNLVSDARELIETYAEPMGAAELPEGILNGYRVRARLELLAGRSQAAFETLQRLEEIGIQRRLDRLVAWSLYDQFALSVLFQHLTSREEILHRLSQLAEKHASARDCSWAQIPLIYALAAAENALYGQADHLECLRLIEVAEDLCNRTGRVATLLRLGFMRCIARLNAGKQQAALSEASELLTKAAGLGVLRALADLGAIARPLAKLLMSRTHGETEHEMLRITLDGDQSTGDAAGASSDSAAVLAEPLTAREQDVLELLGKGFSAKSIGRSLDISLATAKWHLKNVYGKLHAGSREDVLAKARRYGIIS